MVQRFHALDHISSPTRRGKGGTPINVPQEWFDDAELREQGDQKRVPVEGPQDRVE